MMTLVEGATSLLSCSTKGKFKFRQKAIVKAFSKVSSDLNHLGLLLRIKSPRINKLHQTQIGSVGTQIYSLLVEV